MTRAEESPAELAADVRALRRQVNQLEPALAEQRARADALETELQAERSKANRRAIERDEWKGRAEDLAAAYTALREGLELDQESWTVSSPLARWCGYAFAGDFGHFLPDCERVLLQVKPGRIPVLLIEISAALLAPKEVPDEPKARGFARKDILAKVELLTRQGYKPVLLHLREKGWKPGRAQTLHVTGVRSDGMLDPESFAVRDEVAQVDSLREKAQAVVEMLDSIKARLPGQGGAA